jgi:hypothetical protein
LPDKGVLMIGGLQVFDFTIHQFRKPLKGAIQIQVEYYTSQVEYQCIYIFVVQFLITYLNMKRQISKFAHPNSSAVHELSQRDVPKALLWSLGMNDELSRRDAFGISYELG